MKSAVFDIHGIRVRMEYRRIKNINLYVRPEQGEALVTVSDAPGAGGTVPV